jgi:PAS domain S-box-containing protein
MSDVENASFAQKLFEMLYEGEELTDALAFIGTSFRSSRVSLFEDSPRTPSFCNTCEWCASGVEPQQLYRQDLPSSLEGLYFGPDGFSFCPDVSLLSSDAKLMPYAPSVVSVASCAFSGKGVRTGFVSLEFREAITWDEEKRQSFIFATHAIATFLRKGHEEEAFDGTTDGVTLRESISLIADTLDYGFTVFSTGKDGTFRLVSANEPFFKFFGLTREQFGEDPKGILYRSVSPEDAKKIKEMFASILSGKEKEGEVVFTLKRRDGTAIVLDKKASLVPLKGSSSSLLVSSMEDVTAQKKMEEHIASEQLRNQIILEQTNTAVFEWNLNSPKLYS